MLSSAWGRHEGCPCPATGHTAPGGTKATASREVLVHKMQKGSRMHLHMAMHSELSLRLQGLESPRRKLHELSNLLEA